MYIEHHHVHTLDLCSVCITCILIRLGGGETMIVFIF